MRLVAFDDNGSAVLGAIRGDEIIRLDRAAPQLPATLRGLLEADALAATAASLDAASGSAVVSASSIKHTIPLPDPSKIICLGLNYADHAAEGGHARPDYPSFFMRGPSSLAAHNQPLEKPAFSDTMDYEAELVAVIGKRCRGVTRHDALSVIAGYSCFNDGSVREYQRKTSQWTIGKNFDCTGGFGPLFVSADELPPGCRGLSISARVNGKTMQHDNTDNMLFDVAETIELLTACMTLEVGDLVVMGTPAGVGHARKPPAFMVDGDRCEIEIEQIGVLSNPIVERG